MANNHTPQTVACSCCNDNHDNHEHSHSGTSVWKLYVPCIVSFITLSMGLLADHLIHLSFFNGYIRLIWYILAYLPVGIPVLLASFGELKRGDLFNEFSLMSIASIGAFCIGEYPEGVAVMLFYSFGELLQGLAVNKAQRNIKALLDIRPDIVSVFRNGNFQSISPLEVAIGEKIQVKAGERVPLDGTLISSSGSFNTAALTGESRPRTLYKGEQVLAGMINLEKVIEVNVEKKYEDSSLARILEMVEHATTRKAKTELLIRRLAKVYTPIVFLLALFIIVLPFFIVNEYLFSEWLYRGLVFLVISCPCALVVSIPLSYFGGIGAASRNGVLFKGANFLDRITKVNMMIMDKTGTLTKGVFNVQQVYTTGIDRELFLDFAATIERHSNHPIAKVITAYHVPKNTLEISNVEELAGYGLKAIIEKKTVFMGNSKLMKKWNIDYDAGIDNLIESVVIMSIDNKYAGHIVIADEIKDDAKWAVKSIKDAGIRTIMLSGDNVSITEKVANSLGIDVAKGGLLPEDKAGYVSEEKKDPAHVVAFVGDGINDAPVLALSDVGIAMGGMGSDAAIEVADVVIQTDQPSKIATAIQIGKATKRIVTVNIVFVFIVKALIMTLGAFGIASMWAAVFADVGVALIAIVNSISILGRNFEIKDQEIYT